jgi:orotidine-5'-phosphate decarboxylase
MNQLAMIDSKFHDIPQTVHDSVKEATAAGAGLITVHASGGPEMLEAAARGARHGLTEVSGDLKDQFGHKLGLVLGITVLTSLDTEVCESIFGIPQGDKEGIKKKVIQFARMAVDAGLAGVVCSPLEAQALRDKTAFDDLLVVTPGITPTFAVQAGDQKRSTNAIDAMRYGADLVVVGRGINKAADYGLTKLEAARHIAEEIKTGLGE